MTDRVMEDAVAGTPLKITIAFIVSQELAKISSLLPSNKRRSLIVHSLIHSMGLLKHNSESHRIQVVNPRRASFKDLAAYHSKEYLEFVLEAANEVQFNEELGLQDDCPPFTGLSDYVPLVAGATLTACEVLRQNVSDVSICWDGGRHHAHKSRASGYCYVADCILAILCLKRAAPQTYQSPTPLHKPRVMYLDLDLHFSDAVSEAFHRPSSSCSSNPLAPTQTMILSIHHSSPGFFPASPLSTLPNPSSPSYDPFILSLPLNVGASSPTYARIWPIVERVKSAFRPDYVVVQCGVDALAGDPHATFNWSLGSETTNATHSGSDLSDDIHESPGRGNKRKSGGVGAEGSLGWCIDRIVNSWGVRCLLLGGGGYNSPNAARAWSYLTSIAIGNPLDLESPIPDHSAFPLYAPSFTLDVSEGTMQDQNTEDHLRGIETIYEIIIKDIQERMQTAQ
ncbi:Arginase/deacetylase [Coprinopsis marcescibilis]|uniref:histone deacetylase n=1 Tax=Coprinopsis marcescibilis TaxID=230819 RepID=A0A5C3KRF8_COPMA|nr:Arginase/deacetylase [Coprinopsis marcescibilis]